MENSIPETTPDFLMDKEEEVGNDGLKRLKVLVDSYKEYEEEIAELNVSLKKVSELFNNISMVEIPEVLAEFGMSEIKLKTGEKVIVKEDANVSVKDEPRFMLWLKNRKEDDIIKLNYDFSNDMDDEQRADLDEFLIENEYDYMANMGVHHATRKAYFKKLTGIGAKDKEEGIKSKKYMKLQDLPEWANVFVLKKTKIKE